MKTFPVGRGSLDCAIHSFFAIFFETIYFQEKFTELGFFYSKGFLMKIWKK